MRLLLCFFLALLACTTRTSALDCSAQWECDSVSDNYNYVSCVDGQCACRSDLGFSGSATAEDPCVCAGPNNVYWQNEPYCLNYDLAVTDAAHLARAEIIRAKVDQLYQSLVYATGQPQQVIYQLAIDDPAVLGDLFAASVSGRVDPVGSYTSRKSSIEYFYATIWTPYSHVTNVEQIALTADGESGLVAVRYRLDLVSYVAAYDILAPYSIIQSGFYKFDQDNLIDGVELNIHALGKVSDPGTPGGLETAQLVCGIYFYQAGTVAAGCDANGQNCAYPELVGCQQSDDPDGYFTDFEDCVTFLTGLEDGSWSDIPMNTLTCRYYHSLLVAVDKTHCSHVGKTGGGKCYDHAHEDYFNYNYLA